MSFVFAPPALPLGIPEAKVILTLTPGLFFATAPFAALLIRQSALLIPPAVLVVARLTLLLTIATRVSARPLTPLTILLLCSALLFS